MDYKETYEKILGEYRQVFERVDQDNMRAFIDEVKAHERIFLIGVGREGMATRAFAMRLMHMGKEIHWIWDDTTPSIGEGDLLIATLGDGRIGHINYICERAKEAGAMIYVVTGSPSGDTAKNVADKVFFVPAAVYRGTDDVVPSFQPMGNLFEQCLLILFDIIIMTIVDETPGLTFEKMGIDTLKIARKVHKDFESKSLGALCDYYHIENPAAHRAYYDALATAKLYQTLAHYFEPQDPKVFQPLQLQYKIKKVHPATPKQIALLERLTEQKELIPDWDTATLTRSEASRIIDRLLKS